MVKGLLNPSTEFNATTGLRIHLNPVQAKGVTDAERYLWTSHLTPIPAFRVTEVAQHFQRSPMRISQAIIQFENELREGKHLRKTIEKLEEDSIRSTVPNPDF